MFPWLRLILIGIWVSSIAGAVVIIGVTLQQYSLATFVWAGLIGVVVGFPAALLNWIWLRPNRTGQLGWTWRIARWIRSRSPWRRRRSGCQR